MFSGPALERYDDKLGCPPSLPERKDPSFSKRRIPRPEHLLDRGRRRKLVSGNPSGLPFLTLGRRVMFASPSLNRGDDLLSRPSPSVVMTARKSRPHSDHGSAPARTRHQAHKFNFGAVPRWLSKSGGRREVRQPAAVEVHRPIRCPGRSRAPGYCDGGVRVGHEPSFL